MNTYSYKCASGKITPLMAAAASRHTDIAKLLISKGADINATYHDPQYPNAPMKAINYYVPGLDPALNFDEQALLALDPPIVFDSELLKLLKPKN